jgi:signal transduction histidine kinase
VEAQHAQKLEALGRLSAGLAHEINTPIQFVGDNTRFLAEAFATFAQLTDATREMIDRRRVASNLPERCHDCRAALERAERDADLEFLREEIPAAIEQSLDGLARVRTLVRAMRTFSHPGDDKQAPADLNEALTSAVTVARNQVTRVADVVCDLDPLPPVMCSIGDLNQVFLNLLLNAVDAIAESGRRGTLTITTRLEDDEALVSFADTGVGIPEDIRLRIFEPFFTTKEVGRGTGQGLAMARAVVHDKHGGRIAVTSTVGEGSTFTITLPVQGRSARQQDNRQ